MNTGHLNSPDNPLSIEKWPQTIPFNKQGKPKNHQLVHHPRAPPSDSRELKQQLPAKKCSQGRKGVC
jgi:hypothetical protein